MIKKFFTAIACFVAIGLNAQEGTVSPYSYFGIGEFRNISTIENQMMGGISMYADSIHLNLKNPAAYSKLRLTAYGGGLSYKQVAINSFTASESNKVTNLEYLSLAFPLAKRLGAGIGLTPYSSVGYDFTGTTMNVNNAMVTNRFSGSGGLNRFYISLGYELMKNLSIGVTANYNFGEIMNERSQSVENVQFGTFDNRTSRVNGLDMNYAVNYTPNLTEKHTLYTSVRVNTQANLSARNTQEIGSFATSSGQNIQLINVDLDGQGLKETSLKVPTTTTLGLGFGENKKWFLGAEYSFQKLSEFENSFNVIDNFDYEDASTLAFGGYFIPDYTSFNNYLKKIVYRAGVRLTNTGMLVENKSISNFGITFGLGLPLGSGAGGFSNLNLGLELGRQGTTTADLVQEEYFKINLGLSLNDRWFLKRKID